MENSNSGGVERFLEALGENMDSKIKVHLKKLYGCMILSLVTAAMGAAVHVIANPFKVILCTLGAAGFSFLLYMTPKNREKLRLVYLFGFAFLEGVIVGQLATGLFLLHYSAVPMVLLSASIIFASFALTASYASNRKGLYVGGLALSLASTTLWMKALDVIYGSRLLFHLNLHTGLVFVCAFVLYDTHCILEKGPIAEDYVWRPVRLLLNVFTIACRLFVTVFLHPSKKKTVLEEDAGGEKRDIDQLLVDLKSNMKEQTSEIVTSIKSEVEQLDEKVKELQRETQELKKLSNN